MTRLLFTLACMLLAIVSVARAETAQIEVFPLRYLVSDEVISLLRPLLGEGAAVTGLRDQVIVRGTPAQIDAVRRVLERLDRAPRQLLITVQQDSSTLAGHGAAALSGRLEHGPPDRSGGRLRGRIARTHSGAEAVQQVRVLEGYPAQIQVGQSVPATGEVYYGPGGVQASTDYVDVVTGFSVVPRVSGDRVTLEVTPQQAAPGAGGEIAFSRLHTTVTGRLGAWMDLGGAVQALGARAVGGGYTINTNVEGRQRVWLKVEEVR